MSCQLDAVNRSLDSKLPMSKNRRARLMASQEILQTREDAIQWVEGLDPTMQQAVALQASKDAAEASHLLGTPIARGTEHEQFLKISGMTPKQLSDSFGGTLDPALAYLQKSKGLITTREIADVFNKVDGIKADSASGFLKYYDKTMTYLKAWQLSTPGFHARNSMGAAFNNYLAGVEFGSVTAFRKALKQFKAGTLGEQESVWMKNLLERSSAGQYSHAELGVGASGSKWNPLSPNFKYLEQNAKVGGKIEFNYRGALFWDRMIKGQSVQTALDDVVKFHFDYADLSHFEAQGIKRVVPFYVWTRHNFPLQLRMIVENPGKYRYYQQFAQTTEGGKDPMKAVPNYLTNGMFGLPLPMHVGKEGSQVFGTLDLPFTRTMAGAMPSVDNIDPKKPLSYLTAFDPIAAQVTPMIKAPTELALNRQFFSGVPLSDTSKTQGSVVSKALGGISKHTGKNRMDYAMEQAFPLLAQARRVGAPFLGEDKFKDRQMTSWASFLGVPVRANTPLEQRNEMMRIGKLKEAELENMVARSEVRAKKDRISKTRAARKRLR